MKWPLCWLGFHAWRPQTFLWNGGHGTGRACTRCDHYELKTETDSPGNIPKDAARPVHIGPVTFPDREQGAQQ